jgi:polyisoprenoid-binding protein YceI
VRLAFALVMALATVSTARADTWAIDRAAAQVRFQFDRFGLSRPSVTFREIDAQLDFTPTDPESGKVTAVIKAASIDTGVPEFDRLLRSNDFFAVARFPTIEFRSTGVEKTGERTGKLSGDLTLMGITQPVVLDVRWNYTGENPLSAVNPVYQGKWVSGFSAQGTLQRSKWGLKRALPVVPDEIEVSIEIEFIRIE